MNIFTWLKQLGERGEVAVSTPPPATPPPASASASVSLPLGGDGTPPATPATFAIPDSYKDRAYLKGIDSYDKVWSMLDGAQKLIGERPSGIPAPDAPQADWDKFYKAMGRPEKAAEYQFDYGKNADGTPKAAPDVKLDASLKDMMHRHGITAKQAAGLQKDFDAIAQGIMQEKGISEQQLNTDFDKLATETFKERRDAVLSNGKALLEEFTPASMKAALAKLPNESLVIMAGVLDGIKSKFIKADGAPLNPSGTASGASGAEALRGQARELMQHPGYSNSFHPEHESIKTKIADLYQRAAALK